MGDNKCLVAFIFFFQYENLMILVAINRLIREVYTMLGFELTIWILHILVDCVAM